ncbi:MAG: type II secretion system F family protein [Bacteroidota bacterium]
MRLERQYKSAYTAPDSSQEVGEESIWNRDIQLGSPISLKDRYQLYQFLGILMSAGLSILECITIIQEQIKKRKLRGILKEIGNHLQDGLSLAESMEQTPKYFSAFEIYNVQMGEQTGELVDILKNLASFYEKRIKLKRKLWQALSYPVSVILIALLVMVFMINYVVPMFQDVFKRFDAELPPITQFVLDLSHLFQAYASWALLGIGAVVILLLRLRKNEQWGAFTANLSIKLPILGPLLLKLQLARFCYSFSLLIRSKINMDQALLLLDKILTFPPLQSALIQIRQEVTVGNTLYDAMSAHTLFPTYFLQIVRVGERTAQLGNMMDKLAQSLDEESEAGINQLTQFLEPLLIMILGGMVATILVAMYLPMFELGNAIGN